MKKELYYCDLCKREVKTNNHLISVGIKVGDIHGIIRDTHKKYSKDHIHTFNGLQKELCFPCAIKVVITIKTDKRPDYNSETLGDQLYNIVVGIVNEHFTMEER